MYITNFRFLPIKRFKTHIEYFNFRALHSFQTQQMETGNSHQKISKDMNTFTGITCSSKFNFMQLLLKSIVHNIKCSLCIKQSEFANAELYTQEEQDVLQQMAWPPPSRTPNIMESIWDYERRQRQLRLWATLNTQENCGETCEIFNKTFQQSIRKFASQIFPALHA